MNKNEKNNCHYRDCEAITDNLSRIKKGNALSLRGGLMSDEAIFHAETNSVQRLLSRCCKNVEDCRVSAMHFLAMTPVTLALAAVLALGIISESRAESWNCGERDANGNHGSNVICTLDGSVFTISGRGDMGGFYIDTTKWLTLAPWKDYLRQITELKITDGVTCIGTFAMYDIGSISKITIPSSVTSINRGSLAGNKLKSVELPNTVVSIGVNAFESNLLETITIPDSVKNLEKAFDNNPLLKEIYLSDSIDTSNWDISAFDGIGSVPNIICQGQKSICLSKLQKFVDAGKITKEQIIQALEGECNSAQYYDGRVCKKALSNGGKPCAEGFKRNETWCNRVRYTPAEAAAVLKDTDNEIIMTFKVNR